MIKMNIKYGMKIKMDLLSVRKPKTKKYFLVTLCFFKKKTNYNKRTKINQFSHVLCRFISAIFKVRKIFFSNTRICVMQRKIKNR